MFHHSVLKIISHSYFICLSVFVLLFRRDIFSDVEVAAALLSAVDNESVEGLKTRRERGPLND